MFFSFFSFLLPRNDGVGTLVQNTDDKENKQTQTKRYRSRLCTQHTRTHAHTHPAGQLSGTAFLT